MPMNSTRSRRRTTERSPFHHLNTARGLAVTLALLSCLSKSSITHGFTVAPPSYPSTGTSSGRTIRTSTDLCLLPPAFSGVAGSVRGSTLTSRRNQQTAQKCDYLRTPSSTPNFGSSSIFRQGKNHVAPQTRGAASSSTTQLNVWWFGGTPDTATETTAGADSCELVAVRIERTSPNSRRISGEIFVEAPIDDVWAILTDYDNLATHVPNLVESRRVSEGSGGGLSLDFSRVGEQGDGTYRCRLFQKGSQKIIGFEFAASLTMDMLESIIVSGNHNFSHSEQHVPIFPEERKIGFKCVESPFFSEFDGEWKVKTVPHPDGLKDVPCTKVSYIVDVRPRGPVPVAPLEWRIREDVPTNLRAVKKAAMEVGYEGVMALRRRMKGSAVDRALARSTTDVRRNARRNAGRTELVGRTVATMAQRRELHPLTSRAQMDWYEDETMAAYLKDR